MLPGMMYPTRAPVLWFARAAAMTLGYSVLEVLGEPVEHPDQLGWLRECADRAITQTGSARVVVIGKSLASLLAGEVSDRKLPAAWLTPPLTEPAMAQALTAVQEPALLLGGTGDPMWTPEVIPDNPALRVVELPGVDHGLEAPGDLSTSLDALRQMTEALTGWLRRLDHAGA